jgi:hypothetical protein
MALKPTGNTKFFKAKNNSALLLRRDSISADEKALLACFEVPGVCLEALKKTTKANNECWYGC